MREVLVTIRFTHAEESRTQIGDQLRLCLTEQLAKLSVMAS